MLEEGPQNDQELNFRFGRKLFQWLVFLLIFFMVSFVLLTLAIRLPAVQDYGVRKIGASISGQLGVPVKIGSFYYDFKSKLVVKDVFIPDFHNDTLLFAGDVQLQLKTGLLALARNQLHLNSVTICEVLLKDTWYEGEVRSDLSRFLMKDTMVQVETVKKPFDLALHAVYGSDLIFKQTDQRTDKSIQVSLLNGLIDFKGLWKLGGPLVIDHVFLDDPWIKFRNAGKVATEELDELYIARPPDPDTIPLKFPLEGLPEITLTNLMIANGMFLLENSGATENNGVPVTSRPLQIGGIAVHIRDLHIGENKLSGKMPFLAGTNSTGLELAGASIGDFSFDERQLALENFIIETAESSIGDTIRLKYRSFDDWRSFADKVLIDANFQNTTIAVSDIVNMTPSLKDIRFFRDFRGQKLKFAGTVNGRINNLRLKDFVLSIGDQINMKGDISSRNLAVKGEEILNMKIMDLKTSMSALRTLIPGFNAPANFNKLGRIAFKGRFDGYFQDFVAYGFVRTDIGSADLDMRLDLKNGVEKAAYSGALELMEFNLGEWTGQSDLGLVSIDAQVRNGQGLRGSTASADLAANVSSFEYKDYTYRNLQFNGRLNSNLLDGKILLEDPFLNFDFNGTIDFSQPLTQVNFILDLKNLDMQPLGLSEKPVQISTVIDLQAEGTNFDDAQGILKMTDLVVGTLEDAVQLDSLLISQNFVANEKQLILRSPWFSGEVNGRYSFAQLPDQIMALLQQANPQLSRNIGLKERAFINADSLNHFAYDLRLSNVTPILKLAGMKGWELKKGRLQGNYHGKRNTWAVNGDFSEVIMPDGSLKGIHVSTDFFDERINLYVDIDTFTQGGIQLSGSKFYAGIAQDSAILDVAIKDSLFSLDFFEARISLAARDSLFAVHVLKDRIQIDGEPWEFSRNNELVFGNNYFYTRDLSIHSGKKEIGLFPMGKTGIVLDVVSFNGDLINLLLRDPKFRFDGELSGQFRLNHIFKKEGFSGDLTLEPFIVNGDDHGILMVSAEGVDLNHQIETRVQVFRPGGKIEADGWFDLGANADPERIFYFDIGVFTFPMVVLDYLIPNGISDTKGNFSGRLSFFGGKGILQLLGDLVLAEASTFIDFLGTRYFFDDQRIVFKPEMIDFTGAKMKDVLGNTANVSGGLRHKQMKSFTLDARIQSDQFLFLDTKKGENTDYYGKGIGRADVRFSGDFINTNIYVNATTGAGTNFVIPVDDEIGEVSTSFVRFVKKDSTQKYLIDDVQTANLTGLNFAMDLEVKDDALVKIIFDEAQGNIMEGYGRGNIQLNITRNGEFTVRGDYEIERGNYLFTLMNFVNKPFKVRRGGIIRWTGDPLDAQIDIEADYVGLRTSLTNFLTEYGLTGQLLIDAQRATEVLLTMRLSGSLLRPSIDFSLEFPEVPETLRSYVDSKVRNLKANKEQMNTQVFGLIVFRSFLPSNDVSGGILGNTVGSTVGTISEMLANQFSNMISALLSEAVDSWDLVSGVEFNIDYNQPTGAPQGSDDFRFGELAVSQSVRLLNDRWVVTLGANYGNNYLSNNRYFSPQVELSWRTPVEGLNLQIYYRTEQFFTGLKQKAGAGLRFHKEYDSFLGLKKGAEEVQKDQEPNN